MLRLDEGGLGIENRARVRRFCLVLGGLEA
jgi:hypothetical protein